VRQVTVKVIEVGQFDATRVTHAFRPGVEPVGEVLRLVVVEVAVGPVLVGGIALNGPGLRTEGRECRSRFAENGRTIRRKWCGYFLPLRRIEAIISASKAENRCVLFVGTGWLAGANLG
jgi:hypothetical protein